MQDTLKTKFDDATDDPVVDRYIRLPLSERVLSLICIAFVSSAVSIGRVVHTARCHTDARTARVGCWWLLRRGYCIRRVSYTVATVSVIHVILLGIPPPLYVVPFRLCGSVAGLKHNFSND